jgi:hypothetical protein
MDIAAELRRGVGNGTPSAVREAEELMDIAAAEIERLRSALKGAEIAIARDESPPLAMKIILAALACEQSERKE